MGNADFDFDAQLTQGDFMDSSRQMVRSMGWSVIRCFDCGQWLGRYDWHLCWLRLWRGMLAGNLAGCHILSMQRTACGTHAPSMCAAGSFRSRG